MVRFLKQFQSGEKGQALAIVLGLLAIGGLTIAVSLNYATTSLKGSRIVEEKTAGVYAAGAGVEYALWSLGEGDEPPTQLSENISGMSVGMETLNKGTYTLHAGELLGEAGSKYTRLDVYGGAEVVGGDTANYTITLTRLEDFNVEIKLNEVGASLPPGYEYVPGSTSGDLSSSDPSSSGTTQGGAQWVKWEWTSNRPEIPKGQDPEGYGLTVTHSFRITGTDSLEGDYAWAWSQTGGIGLVGEITGTRYTITATATRPEDGRTTAEIVAGILIVGGDMHVVSWQITK
ncbi:hypothetical protein ES703_38358 [subsurface metagenome]